MAKNTLYLHIGTHKTGSTAIQRTLRAQADALAKEHIYFVHFKETKSLFSKKAVDGNRAGGIELVKVLKKALRVNRDNPNAKFILSKEIFSGVPFKAYQNAPVVVQNLKQILADFDVKVLVYLRRQDDFIESMYTQFVHRGNSTSFDDFANKLTDKSAPLNWDRHLKCFSDAFGRENMIVRRYDRKFLPNRNSLIQQCAEVFGSKALLEGVSDALVSNPGFSRDALEVARMAYPALNKTQKKVLRLFLQRNSAKKPFDKYSFFTDEQRQEVYQTYLPSNTKVAQDYFPDSDGPLFPEPMPASADQIYPGLKVESAVALIAQLTIELNQRKSKKAGKRGPTKAGKDGSTSREKRARRK